MTYFFWIWLAVCVASLLVEFLTFQLVSIWFFPAGLVALILDACSVPLSIQLIVFFVLSTVLLVSFRKIALKFIGRNDNTKTNAESTVGEKLRLLSDVGEDTLGTVKINGVVWSVKSEDGQPIAKDAFVQVVRLEGNKYIVKEIK